MRRLRLAPLLLAACAGREAKVADPPAVGLDESRLARVSAEVDQAMLRGVVACRALAENIHVRTFRAGSEQPQRTLTVLRDIVTRAEAEHASLIDGSGVVVASTDPQAVGYDFSEWPFLRHVAAGEVLVFPAVGIGAGRRRIFFVAPRGEDGGAAVLRHDVSAFDRLLDGVAAPAALVYRGRYEVATNRTGFGFDGLDGREARAVDPGERSVLAMMDEVFPPIGDTLVREGTAFDVRRAPTVVADWQILVCTPRP